MDYSILGTNVQRRRFIVINTIRIPATVKRERDENCVIPLKNCLIINKGQGQVITDFLLRKRINSFYNSLKLLDHNDIQG